MLPRTTETIQVGTFKRNSKISQAVVGVGKNDKVNPLTEQSIQQLIRVLQDKFPNANITCYEVLPDKNGLSDSSVKFNRALKEVCSVEEQIGLTNFEADFLQGGPTLYSDDGIHLNSAGSKCLSQSIRNLLQGLDAVEGDGENVSGIRPQNIETVISVRNSYQCSKFLSPGRLRLACFRTGRSTPRGR